jgi:DNA-binding Lrp family transcriptional regulator
MFKRCGMDEIDKKILNTIQNGLPIESRPFLGLAKELHISEDEVISRVKNLKEKKYIRRFGGIFNSKKLGYSSTLCAISVPEPRIAEISKIINSYNEVTHNYIRDNYYNIWFTIIASSRERLEGIIHSIKIETGIENIIILTAKKLFKVKATFKISEE